MGATIDVAELTKKINAKGEAKRKAEISEKQAFYDDLIKKVKHINKNFLKDAKKLIELCYSMSKNNLEPFGKQSTSCWHDYPFLADTTDHKVGFIAYDRGGVAIACLGGGCDGNTGAVFCLQGQKLKWSNTRGEAQGDMLELLANPEKYIIAADSHLFALTMKHYADRINTIYKDFEKFRDDYIAYVTEKTK